MTAEMIPGSTASRHCASSATTFGSCVSSAATFGSCVSSAANFGSGVVSAAVPASSCQAAGRQARPELIPGAIPDMR
ncbi:MAG: hypothetical protein ACE5NC_06620, partial [Anaerolineae bacterium]